MSAKWLGFGILMLAVGFGLGRLSGFTPAGEEERSLASFQQALVERDPLQRWFRVSSYLQGLSPEELPDAVAVLQAQPRRLQSDELRAFMLAWARFDPHRALEQALAWPAADRRRASGAAMFAYAFYQPEAGSRMLARLPEGKLRDFLQERMLEGWAASGRLGELNAYLASLPEGDRRNVLVALLAREVARDGPQALVRWRDEFPAEDPALRQFVVKQVRANQAAARTSR
ncbi:MAG: hypothetical protein HRU02_04465 [Myxococcales bacterium]|nr:hypothetical protein [Myxococcales bacterium]